MKKVALGFILGVGLTLSFNVYAAVESIIGKKVEGTAAVKLDGSKLDKESIIVDGSSYAPVRAIGESLGLDVGFKDGEVILNKKEKGKQVHIPTGPETLEDYDAVIKGRNDMLPLFEQQLKELKGKYPNDPAKIKEFEDKIQAYKNETADLEKQKAELTKP